MGIKITSILKHSLKYSVTSIFTSFLSIPKNVILAMVLIPRDFGVYAFVWLFVEYSYQLSPGFINSSTREMTYHIGKNEYSKAKEVESIGLGADLIYTLFLAACISFLGIFFNNENLIIFGFIFAGVNFLINKVNQYYHNANYFRDNYNVTVIARAIQNGGASILSVILVFLVKEWSLFIGPLAASFLALVFYFFKSKYKISFKFNKKLALNLFKTGIFLSLAWFLWRSFRIADKTIISAMLSKHELGIFVFASLFILFPHNILLDFGNVLMPLLWRFWGDNSPEKFTDNSRKFAYFISISSAVIISVIQFLYFILIKYFATKFYESFEFFNILCFSLFFMSIVILPNIMLASKNINKQKISVFTHSFGLIFNVIGDILVIKAGYGLLGVVWITLITQIVVTCAQFFISLKYFAVILKKKIIFILKLIFPIAVVVILLFIQSMFISNLKTMYFIIIYPFVILLFWFLTLFLFYKDVIRLSEVKQIFFKLIKRQK